MTQRRSDRQPAPQRPVPGRPFRAPLVRAVRQALLALTLVGASGPSLAAVGNATPPIRSYDIPPGPLGPALARYASESGINIAIDPAQVAGRITRGLSGQFARRDGLTRLLADSGLDSQPVGAAGYVLRPSATSHIFMLHETRVLGSIPTPTDIISAPRRVSAEEINQRNTGDGNITDLMKTNPAVQFANNDSNSMNQGEIKPSRISIHGSNSYQNAYRLDGVSFNNDFDPADSGLGETSTRLSSGDQGIYIDSRLIDSMSVYDNNIPVEYGGFTGGAIEVSTRRWQGENSAHAYYRMTRSGWNSLFSDTSQPIDSSKNDTAKPFRFQDRYEKRDFGGWFEVGLSEHSGIVFSASRRSSTIPIRIIGGGSVIIDADKRLDMVDLTQGTRNQRRVADNYFLKYSIDISARNSLDLSTHYAAYDSRLFSASIMNSGYDSTHNGLGLTAQFKHKFDIGLLDLTASAQHLEDNRKNDQKYALTVRAFDEHYNMAELNSGGLGDLLSKQQNYGVKTAMRFNEREDRLGLKHKPTAGAESNYTKGIYRRGKDYFRYTYSGSIDKNNVFNGYLNNITRFQAGSYSADYTNYAIFLDDLVQYRNLTLRPGIRLERDDFVKKTNIAPRLSGSYDMFGDGRTQIIAGANRYYGRSILTYALYGAQNAGMQLCNGWAFYPCSLNPDENYWEDKRDYEGMESLKTPYNDEFTLALQQKIFSATWRLQYVRRAGHDEVRNRTKYNTRNPKLRSIRVFDNGGRSSHDSVTLFFGNAQPWKWANATHIASASLTWQQSKSNTPKDTGYSEFDSSNRVNLDKVWYDGKVIDASKLPSTSFNSPVKFNLEITSFWHEQNITWYNRLQWWGARNQAVRYENDYAADPIHGQIRKYGKQHYASKYVWDTRLNWQPGFARGLGFSVEVNNVLNSRNIADRFTFENRVLKSYDPGRQFWLQVNYDF